VTASLVVGGVLVLAMIAASARAAIGLAAHARIPIHLGSPEHCWWASKRAGLVIWPAAGAVCYGVLGGLTASHVAANWVPGVRAVLMPAVMCVAFAFEVGALMLARRSAVAAAVPAVPAGEVETVPVAEAETGTAAEDETGTAAEEETGTAAEVETGTGTTGRSD
jgi:hypothetical protein